MAFFNQLKKENKVLYYGILIFMFFTLLANSLRLEIVPFFVFKMYSYPLPTTKEVPFYVLEYNNKEFNVPEIWNHHKRMLFYYSIEHQQDIQKNNGYDKFQTRLKSYFSNIAFLKEHSLYPYQYQKHTDYAQWLSSYLEEVTKEKIKYIKIFKVVVVFDKYKIKVKNRKQIIEYVNRRN
ncbi:hypothetical protein FYC62_08205 [Pedobacter aquae]|uniref:Uncharacterized protein n=1 Tax=Pedobacter aquae TaxID=2605747 RepID=A0A5C0VIP9_9SPHI|nr:hypothetical protein [Pedobacter aquae]QEK51643.1 hypothetical protein FYC62_08205 [Pedobacter aquae]